MPKLFRVFNANPSFTDSTNMGAGTINNPYPNYGAVGDHINDYFFYRMRERPNGGAYKLAAYAVSQPASLTGMVESGLTQFSDYVEGLYNLSSDFDPYNQVLFGEVGVDEFGNPNSEKIRNLGLIDFRGATGWNILIGDGILGQSNTGSTAFLQTSTAAVSILSHFKNRFPDINWTYAGFPHLPQFTVYAPNLNESPSWDAGVTNTGVTATNYWDKNHPKIGTIREEFYPWSMTPSSNSNELKNFYRNKAINSVIDVLDACDWLCPDINPTIDHEGINRRWFSVEEKLIHTSDLIDLCADYRDQRVSNAYDSIGNLQEPGDTYFGIYPLINTFHRSRDVGKFDDPFGGFSGSSVIGINLPRFSNYNSSGVTSSALDYDYGYSGHSYRASDMPITPAVLKGGMLEPAARLMNSNDGFVYLDQVPFLIDIACTADYGDNTLQRTAQLRARNYILRKLYPYQAIISPEYTLAIVDDDTFWIEEKSSFNSYFSYNTAPPYVKSFPETIPIGTTISFSDITLPEWTGDDSSIGVTNDNFQDVWDSSLWNSAFTKTTSSSAFTNSFYGVFENCCDRDVICCRPSVGGGCAICETVPGSICDEHGGSEVNDCRECDVDGSQDRGVCYHLVDGNPWCDTGGRGEGVSRCDCETMGGEFYPVGDSTIEDALEDCIDDHGGGISIGDPKDSGAWACSYCAQRNRITTNCFKIVDPGLYGYPQCRKLVVRTDGISHPCCGIVCGCGHCYLYEHCSRVSCPPPCPPGELERLCAAVAQPPHNWCEDPDCPDRARCDRDNNGSQDPLEDGEIPCCPDDRPGEGILPGIGSGSGTDLGSGTDTGSPVEYTIPEFLLSPDVSDSSKEGLIERLYGTDYNLAGASAVWDIDRFIYTSNSFPLHLRNLGRIANNMIYFKDLPYNVDRYHGYFSFRNNIKPNAEGVAFIRAMFARDLFLINHTYIP